MEGEEGKAGIVRVGGEVGMINVKGRGGGGEEKRN